MLNAACQGLKRMNLVRIVDSAAVVFRKVKIVSNSLNLLSECVMMAAEVSHDFQKKCDNPGYCPGSQCFDQHRLAGVEQLRQHQTHHPPVWAGLLERRSVSFQQLHQIHQQRCHHGLYISTPLFKKAKLQCEIHVNH
jgi:hypothetical protein